MGEIISILFYGVFLLVGQVISRLVFSDQRGVVRLWLGTVTGQVLVTVLPALWSFAFGWTATSQYTALITVVIIGVVAFALLQKNKTPAFATPVAEEKSLLILLPFLVLGVYLFSTHTFMEIDGALYVGQSTYGDLAMHIGFVSSLTEQGFFPPEYSILPGTKIGYPFLCDSISATFHTLGAGLRFSMLLPAIIAYTLVLLGVFLFFESWLKNKKTTVFAFLLFFIGGGFGFVYFLDLLAKDPANFTRIFTGYYTTPTNFVEKGVLWVNPIADMLVPQRATLFGWSLLFPALFLLRRAAFEEDKKMFLPLAVLAGCMPLVHTHSFLSLGIISAVYLFFALARKPSIKDLQGWIVYGGLVVLLAFPQLFAFTFQQSEGFLKFNFNWVNSTDNYLWFYIKNMGLIYLLLPLSFLNLDKKDRQFFTGPLVVWLIAEFIQFQPNPYDNNKLIFVRFAYTCAATAKLLFHLYDMAKELKGRQFVAVVFCLCLFSSGVLTLGREAVSRYQLFSESEVEAAQFIKENTRPDAYFLTASNHNNLVAALSGRNIHCGSSIFVHFIGLDYSQRAQDLNMMYTQPEECFEAMAKSYGIDYVLFSSHERRGIEGSDESYFRARYPVFYEKDDVTIYKIQ